MPGAFANQSEKDKFIADIFRKIELAIDESIISSHELSMSIPNPGSKNINIGGVVLLIMPAEAYYTRVLPSIDNLFGANKREDNSGGTVIKPEV